MGPSQPKDASPAEKLGLLMQQLMGLVHQRFAGDALAIMNESGITLPQLVALHVLRYGGPQSISSLQEHLKLSASATSHLVDRLVSLGFVDRQEDPVDRRQKRCEITADAVELVDRLAQERTGEFTRALQALDADLTEQLVAVLERAVAQLRRGPPGPSPH